MFNRFLQAIIYAGAGLAVFSILATGMYYAMPVTTVGLIACAISSSILTAVILRSSATKDLIGNHSDPSSVGMTDTIRSLVLVGISIASLGAWWCAVLTHPILDSVRSPWLAINPATLFWLFIPAVCAVVLLMGEREGGASPVRTAAGFGVIVITLFSALSFAAAAYPLGFGFDPFLHRATIQHIAEHGTITPKPLYYIGEYVIELFAMKVLHLPLKLVDVYLTPLLAATLIPAAVFLTSKEGSTPRSTPTAAILLFLPIAAFIQTTPQALAFVFTTLAVLIGSGSTPRSIPTAAIFAVAALCAHPIAGLPAVFFVAMTYTAQRGLIHGSTPTAIIAIVSAVALPLAFIAQSLKAHMPLGLHWPTLANGFGVVEPLLPWIGTHFNAWGDTAYLVIGNMFIVTVILGIIGAWRVYQEGRYMDRPVQRYVPLICAGIAFSNFLILGLFFEFPFLISYERADFAARMLTLTVLFLLPYIPHAFEKRVDARVDPYLAGRIFTTVMIGVVFVSTVYGAFPRNDAYASSAGFNVTQADFDAVNAIEKYAAGRDYVVLANQATSSAAMAEFGFKKYYHGDIFFYPIPTGGPLYKLYLDMAEAPTEETIEQTRKLTGEQLVFFVMNDYWWDSARVIEQTKTITDTSWTFSDQEVTVMVFEN